MSLSNLFSVLIASKAYTDFLYKLTKQNLDQGNKVDRLNFCFISFNISSIHEVCSNLTLSNRSEQRNRCRCIQMQKLATLVKRFYVSIALFINNHVQRELCFQGESNTHTDTHAQSDSSEFHADEKIDSASISCKVSASKNDWPVEFRIRPKSLTVQT